MQAITQSATKKVLSTLLALSLLFGMIAMPAAAAPSAGVGAAAYAYGNILDGKLLKPFTLAGSYEDMRINNYTVNAIHAAYLWNKTKGEFEPVDATADAIVGNFVQLWDITDDGKVDGILIVDANDSKNYWDSEMYWNDDFDDGGAFSDGQAWRIPFGERLLEEYGTGGAVEDFSNILDYAALEESTYWPLHDYYRAESGGTLTMLSGFRTTQQATGWTCGPTSAVMVLDWFGLRGDLNEQDLAALRKKPAQGGATNLQQMVNIFQGLNTLHDMGKGEWGKWEILSTYDIAKQYDIAAPLGEKRNLARVGEVMDGSLFRQLLEDGIPILIGWNSFGGHWQVVIGYDDMGSEDTKDHVLILADPYDTTDHRNDGYNIQSLERFVFDWSAGFDPDFDHGIFVAAVPEDWAYSPVTEESVGEGIAAYREGYDGDGSDAMKLPYGRTAEDIERFYPATPWRGSNGLAGAATGGYERVPNDYVNESPYYAHYDYFNWKSGESPVSGGELIMLENFRTQQQTTEWTCGLTTALMAMEWYKANLPGDGRLTEISLAQLRGEGRAKPGATTLDDMKHVFDSLNADNGYLNALARANGWKTQKKWAYLTTDDLSDNSDEGFILGADGEEHYLADGAADGGMIPYYLSLGCPILIGWNEWGGHWQAIIGYDDMGTADTQDDVLILADPYDTTDHNQDGYYLEAFERLVYGWVSGFDPRGGQVFLIPYLVDTKTPAR